MRVKHHCFVIGTAQAHTESAAIQAYSSCLASAKQHAREQQTHRAPAWLCGSLTRGAAGRPWTGFPSRLWVRQHAARRRHGTPAALSYGWNSVSVSEPFLSTCVPRRGDAFFQERRAQHDADYGEADVEPHDFFHHVMATRTRTRKCHESHIVISAIISTAITPSNRHRVIVITVESSPPSSNHRIITIIESSSPSSPSS
jgi:hypothetical protein